MPLLEGALLSAVTLAFTLITKRAKKAAKKQKKAKPVPPKDDSHVESRLTSFIDENRAILEALEYEVVADPPAQEAAPPKQPFNPILKCEVELKNGAWKNWGRNLTVYPSRYFEPVEEGDLQAILEKAIEARKTQPNLRVRTHAHAHSWNEIFANSGDWFVSMEKYMNNMDWSEKIHLVDDSELKKSLISGRKWRVVEMWASTRTGDMESFAMKHRYGLAQDMILETALYGGVIATGCHSSSKEHGLISDLVMGMDILQISKDNKVVLRKLRDPDVFKEAYGTTKEEWAAAKVNLGLFGIMKKLYFRVEKDLYVKVTNIAPPVSDYIPKEIPKDTVLKKWSNETLKNLIDTSYYAEIFWYPFNSYKMNEKYDPYGKDCLYIKYMKKTDEKPTLIERYVKEPIQKFLTHVQSYIRTGIGANLLTSITHAVPKSTPILLGLGFNLLKSDIRVKDKIHLFTNAIHFQYDIDLSPVRNLEVCFQVDKNYRNATEMIQATINYITEKHEQQIYPCNVTVECRFTKNSPSLLAASNENKKAGWFEDPVYCWLEVVSGYNMDLWPMLVRELGEIWYKICPEMRPHWAKDHPDLSKLPKGYNSVEFMKKQYGEDRLKQFNNFRVQHDPQNFFVNKWYSAVFDIDANKTA